jgi:hypothetical protein
MKEAVMIDLRNIYQPDELRRQGFTYESVGRPGLSTRVYGALDRAVKPPDLASFRDKIKIGQLFDPRPPSVKNGGGAEPVQMTLRRSAALLGRSMIRLAKPPPAPCSESASVSPNGLKALLAAAWGFDLCRFRERRERLKNKSSFC